MVKAQTEDGNTKRGTRPEEANGCRVKEVVVVLSSGGTVAKSHLQLLTCVGRGLRLGELLIFWTPHT